MKNKSYMYIILAGLLWGTSGIFVNLLVTYGFTALQLTFFRGAVSFVSLGVYALFHNKSLFRIKRKELLLFLGCGLSFFTTASCYYYSMQMTSISTAVILMYTAPIFVMIYSVSFLGEKFTKQKAISVGCMIIGCGLVSGVIGGVEFEIAGVFWGLLSGVSYSVYNILTKISMNNKSNPITTTLYSFLFATLLGMFVCELPSTLPYIMSNAKVTLLLIVGMGLCTCTVPFFLYTLALKDIPAGTASTLSIIEPMAATVYGVLLFDEALTLSLCGGAALILLSVFLLNKNGL
ncbi:MAG: EamA family transporter [Lachnospiraceae bacterium]|nr:EamA family transporter [Lachnospiraceae bacterium]